MTTFSGIHYLLIWNSFSSQGVLRKAKEAVKTWASSNVRVVFDLVSRDPEAATWINKASAEVPDAIWRYAPYRSAVERDQTIRRTLASAVALGTELLFTRFDVYSRAIAEFGREHSVVMEVNTNDVTENPLRFTPRSLVHHATRRQLLRVPHGLIFVTNELKESPDFAQFTGLRAVISNGIELSNYPICDKPPTDSRTNPHLVFIGSPNQRWHGIDKVLRSAAELPDLIFDIIGMSAQNAPSNVHFHGYLTRTQYEPLLRSATVALGTLALHRKGMSEASPIKVREYLALGVPTIIGYVDTDFPQDAPFLLQLPNTEQNVHNHQQEILRFVRDWGDKRVPRSAVASIDTNVKEQARLGFFEQVTHVKHGAR